MNYRSMVMEYRKVQLRDPEGLHARNSAQICMAVRKRDARVSLRLGEREAKADQILEVMALDANCGDWIEIRAEGREASETMKAILDVLQESTV